MCHNFFNLWGYLAIVLIILVLLAFYIYIDKKIIKSKLNAFLKFIFSVILFLVIFIAANKFIPKLNKIKALTTNQCFQEIFYDLEWPKK